MNLGPDLWGILFQTLIQANLSSILSVGIGFFISLGLLAVRGERFRQGLEFFFILPQVLPALFVMLIFYQLFGYFNSAPSGLSGVLLIHVFINSGFCGLQIYYLLKEKLSGMAELAYVEGASLFLFYKKSLPAIRRDLISLFFTVFVFCFMSFSIPLVIGGPASETLEIYIYKTLVTEGQISQAAFIAFFQIVFIALLGLLLRSQIGALTRAHDNKTQPFSSKYFLVLPIFLYAVAYLILASGWPRGFSEFLLYPNMWGDIFKAWLGTIYVSLTAGTVSLFLLLLISYFWRQPKLSSVLFMATSPSPVLIGLFLFAIGWSSSAQLASFLFLGLLLSVLFFPSIFRFGVSSSLEGVESKIQVAEAMGAGRFLIFYKITAPLLIRSFCLFAGLVALWAAGDFALSLFVLPVEGHLALFIKMLLARYRLELAAFLCLILMFTGFFSFLFFQGLGYVLHRKLN